MFKWFGSKWQSARNYPSPVNGAIVEPYCGGAGYSLNYPWSQVTIWDDDPHVQALWRWLIGEAASACILEIPLDLPVGTDIRAVGLGYGQQLLLKHWQRTNNVGECWTISPWGDKPGQWTANTRARVAEQLVAVKHWALRPPWDIMKTPVTWFIDPPYLYNYRYSKTLPPFDHGRLAKLVQEIHRDSLVICCEAIGKGGELPAYLPFKQSHLSVTSRRKPDQSHHSSELVYVRRPAAIAHGQPSLAGGKSL